MILSFFQKFNWIFHDSESEVKSQKKLVCYNNNVVFFTTAFSKHPFLEPFRFVIGKSFRKKSRCFFLYSLLWLQCSLLLYSIVFCSFVEWDAGLVFWMDSKSPKIFHKPSKARLQKLSQQPHIWINPTLSGLIFIHLCSRIRLGQIKHNIFCF